MSRDAMKLALEALEMSHELDETGYADAKKYGLASDEDITARLSTAITALREALAEQPAQRKPLSEEWIRSRCGQTWVFEAAKQWVRLTEAAHNIKENT